MGKKIHISSLHKIVPYLLQVPSAALNAPAPPPSSAAATAVATPPPSKRGPVSIMLQEKAPQGQGGHRERDRLKLLEERRKGGEDAAVQRERQVETVLEARREREKQRQSARLAGQGGFKDGANAESTHHIIWCMKSVSAHVHI